MIVNFILGVFYSGVRCVMFAKDGSAGTLCPAIMAECGFGGARPPGEPPSMTQS